MLKESPVAVDIVTLLAEVRMELAGGRLALKRALRNLVENAVNYGGHADLCVTRRCSRPSIASSVHAAAIRAGRSWPRGRPRRHP